MFTLPPLSYPYSALSPVISETTLRTHHGHHHARYVRVVNDLLASQGRRIDTLEDVVAAAHVQTDRALFNNAAQAWNHGFFWACMRPGGAPAEGALADAITRTFGSLAALGETFRTEGAKHFGSGWVWLVDRNGSLSVLSTHDGDTPLTLAAVTPLIVCDVWEHAYYLDYKQDRAGFLAAWWEGLVDWSFAARQFEAARTGVAGWRYPAPEPVA